jgi:Transposase and inactivated derivatives
MHMTKIRRTHSASFKARLVLEFLKGVKSQSEICREHALAPSLFGKWITQFEQRMEKVFEDAGTNEHEHKIEKLEHIVGRQAIEIDFLKRGLRLH